LSGGKKEKVKSPLPLLLCPILDYVKDNYMVLLGIARY
jgi:hypothetical protein